MNKIGIFYFSGTGNTEIAAKMIRDAFIEKGLQVDFVRIEDVLKKKLEMNMDQYDLVGIGSQVIGYGAPRLLLDFVKVLPAVQHKNTFVFRTAGGVAPINYNASKPLIRKLKRKGYKVTYERLFSISSNWVVRFDDEVVRQLHSATHEKINAMCDEIIAGKERSLESGLGWKLVMEPYMAIAPTMFRFVGKDMRVNEDCKNCGKCIRNCPVNNIVEQNGRIRFKFNCNSCMRCVYECPQEAISYRTLGFFRVPGKYNIRKLVNQEKAAEEAFEGTTPPFFEAYISDLSM